MGYKYLEHTADIAVEIKANSITELFQFASSALIENLTDPQKIQATETATIEFAASSFEEALVSFLSEINYLFTVKKWACSKIENMCMETSEDEIKFTAVIKGENLTGIHILKEEIKAITFHQMEIKEHNGKFRTRIVFDI